MRLAGMVLVGFSSLSSGGSMAMFAMIAFQMQVDAYVGKEREGELDFL